MSFAQGIDFRATAAYVTDPANEPEISAAANYPRTPTVGNSTGVGWEQAISGRLNRSTSVDPRLAGIAYSGTGATVNYRIDLPAPGDYSITLAIGDAAAAQRNTVELFDNAASLGVVCNEVTTLGGQFVDASGVTRSSASDWVANNVRITKTFTSTILRVRLTHPTNGANTAIAHVRVEDAAAPPVNKLTGVWGLVG